MEILKVSVIITTYNMERYIKKSLESALNQITNFSYEIIISDDCSTDNTLKILEHYQIMYDKKVRIINSATNTGIIENIKRALKSAKGKYIAFLDADDYWITNDKLQKQYDILEKQLEIDYVYTNFKYIDENGICGGNGIDTKFRNPIKGNFIPYLLAPYISPSCICFKKQILDFQIFNELNTDKYSSQEYALFLDFTAKANGYFLNEITMHYTVRKNSLSRKNNFEDKIKTTQSSFEVANQFLKAHPIPYPINEKRIFNYNLKLLLISWESMNINVVKRFTTKLTLLQFLKYNPKATYIYIASKNKYLYQLFRPWVLRKRPPGK